MSETELYRRIEALESENFMLRAELKRLQQLLGMPLEQADVEKTIVKRLVTEKTITEQADADKTIVESLVTDQTIAEPIDLFDKEEDNEIPSIYSNINKYSSPEEKIELFRSLFQGRTDVYAKRYYSKRHETAYYTPACANEWDRIVCEKPRVKCKNCTKRELLPLTNEVIESHLRNKDEDGNGIIGIYPLLPDDNCLFLAIDFDEENWQHDVTVFRLVCKKWGIPAAVERSRSGNGAHVWLFFETPVQAISARKLGNTLLTKAMSFRHEIRFSSYDRMFPNQDFMPKGGFGNLIALPLQGGARIKGNSEFVDDNFKSHLDQWAYLASIKKLTLERINKILSKLCKEYGLGELGDAETDTEENPKPWERKKREIKLHKTDFPDRLTIVEANRLYIPKLNISQRALNSIKRLAAFSNPQFYKTQKMRLSTFGVPQIIYSLDETAEYMGIPRGCRSSLISLLNDSKVDYTIEDKRNRGRPIDVSFKGTLHEEQQLAAETLLQHENGVLCVPTAFGKTVIGASLIAQRKCNTLILVHLQTLFTQWKKSLEQFLEINETFPETTDRLRRKKLSPLIGQRGSGKNTVSGIIDIALMQSLVHDNEVDELVMNYGMVIVDECHHVPSFTYEKALGVVNARYVYGLTATPTRQDGQHPIIFMQCGAIRYFVDAKLQASKRDFEHYITPCFTGFKKPFTQNEADWHITKIYSAIVEDEFRNQQIVADVLEAVHNNRTPLILTHRKEHVLRLCNLLNHQTDAHVITLLGTNSAKIKAKMEESLTNIPHEEKLIIIATGKYVGEGFDYPRLDTLFLASPIAWKGTLAQYAGRLHRAFSGKQEVIVYDYVDIHVPVLERMYHKRLKGYAQIGYKTLAAHNQPDKINLIYDATNFVEVIKSDFAKATKAIFIVSPFLRRKRIDVILKWLYAPLQSGIPVTVVTRPPESFREQDRIKECIEYLQSSVTVIQRPKIHQKFILIDNCLVWYGSINLLSYSHSEESIMRLESRELACELEDIMK
jgi:superfamily II DNA or RNA helicase